LLVPWYWTDDIARLLVETGRTTADVVGPMLSVPTAVRRDEASIEAVAQALLDDEEIPLAA
jgi:hypothetical protein